MIKKISILLIGAFFIMMIMVMFSGCITKKKCNAKFPPEKETVIETHYKETIRDSFLKGATVRDTIFINKNYPLEINRWHYIRDTSGLASLRWKIDEQGRMIAECKSENRKVTLKDKEKNSSQSQSENRIQTEYRTPWYNYLFLGVALSFIAYLMLTRKKA